MIHQQAIGVWDFDERVPPYRSVTFSVGIFQWQAKKTERGHVKRGPVVIRIRGYTSNPQKVFDEAKRVCALLNAGECAPGDFKKSYLVS